MVASLFYLNYKQVINLSLNSIQLVDHAFLPTVIWFLNRFSEFFDMTSSNKFIIYKVNEECDVTEYDVRENWY